MSETELHFEKQDESVKTITVSTEEVFHLDKQPDWLELEVNQSLKTIKISAHPNYSKQTREVLLKVFDSDSQSYLKITQLGEEEEKEPYSFKHFPNSNVSSYTTSEVDGKCGLKGDTENTFIKFRLFFATALLEQVRYCSYSLTE